VKVLPAVHILVYCCVFKLTLSLVDGIPFYRGILTFDSVIFEEFVALVCFVSSLLFSLLV